MARNEEKLALRAALREGVVPANVDELNMTAAGKSRRFARGNISLQLKPPLTKHDVETKISARP
jgi:hypothetical protein